METKECTRCHLRKPLSEFYLARTKKSGLTCECKDCHKARYYQSREKTLERERVRYQEDEQYADRKRQRAHRQREGTTAEERRTYWNEWAKRRPEVAKANRLRAYHTRQARLLSVTSEPIDFDAVGEAWDWTCYLCGHPIPKRRGLDADSLAYDHVIPLSRGGANVSVNLRPTHNACNVRKGNKLLTELPASHTAFSNRQTRAER